jgi:hypothetical protein
MNRWTLSVAMLCGLWSASATGADPRTRQGETVSENAVTVSPGMTQEMWFYEQEQRQYNDPKLQARKRQEFAGQQRRMRIESRKWFGYSNLRPTVSNDPYNTPYQPHWVGNGPEGEWVGVSSPSVVVRPVVTVIDPTRLRGLW